MIKMKNDHFKSSLCSFVVLEGQRKKSYSVTLKLTRKSAPQQCDQLLIVALIAPKRLKQQLLLARDVPREELGQCKYWELCPDFELRDSRDERSLYKPDKQRRW